MPIIVWLLAIGVIGLPILIRCARVHRLLSRPVASLDGLPVLAQRSLRCIGAADVAVRSDLDAIEPAYHAAGRELVVAPTPARSVLDLAMLLRAVAAAAKGTSSASLAALRSSAMAVGLGSPVLVATAIAGGWAPEVRVAMAFTGMGVGAAGVCLSAIVDRREAGPLALAERAGSGVVHGDDLQAVRAALSHQASSHATGLSWFCRPGTWQGRS